MIEVCVRVCMCVCVRVYFEFENLQGTTARSAGHDGQATVACNRRCWWVN